MVELDVETERRDCVTFVAATVRNDGTAARRLRLRTPLRPVWPPRRQGVPAAGWYDGGVTLTVPAGRRRGVGFATPASPDGTVLTVAESVPADDGAGSVADVTAGEEVPAGDEVTPEHVVRALGDPTPPADAVPVAGDGTAGCDGGGTGGETSVSDEAGPR